MQDDIDELIVDDEFVLAEFLSAMYPPMVHLDDILTDAKLDTPDNLEAFVGWGRERQVEFLNELGMSAFDREVVLFSTNNWF